MCFEAEIAQAISCCHAAHLQMALCHSLCYTKLRRATFLCRQPPGRPLPKCFRRPLDMTAVSRKKGLHEMHRAFLSALMGLNIFSPKPRSKFGPLAVDRPVVEPLAGSHCAATKKQGSFSLVAGSHWTNEGLSRCPKEAHRKTTRNLTNRRM